MGSVIQHWITTKLGLPVPYVLEPVNFRKHLSNGYLLAEILRKYNIISDDQLISLGRSYSEKIRVKNMNYVHRWMTVAGLSVNMEDLNEIIKATPGAAVKFLYNLYFILEATNLDCKVNKGLCTRLRRSLIQQESSVYDVGSAQSITEDFQAQEGQEEEGSSSPAKCKVQRQLGQCVSSEPPIPVRFFPLKPDTTEASRLYFATEALKRVKSDKLCLLETICEAEERRRCPQVEEPSPPPPPPTSRKSKCKPEKTPAEKKKESQITLSIVNEMNRFDEMVASKKSVPVDTTHFQEMKNRCYRPVEFGELEEERNFFQALFGKKTKPQKGIVTVGLEGGGQCWTTFDTEAKQIVQQLLGWTFDLAMKVVEWKEVAGSEPPQKLFSQWKAVIFHIPPLEMGRVLRESLGPITQTCLPVEEGDEEDAQQVLDEEDFIKRNFYNLHEEFTVEKILAEERKLILLQTQAEKEMSILADMTSYEKAMGDYSEWLKKKEKETLVERIRCFRRSGEGSEECSNEVSLIELEQEEHEEEETTDFVVAESSFAVKTFIRGVVAWSIEVATRISDFKTETDSEAPKDKICWWKCGLWRSLIETGGFGAWEDQEAAIHDEWLLQEDFVCGSFAGKIEDCNLAKVLADERIIKKLKDQVELDYRLGKELDAYDEMVMDPDYLTVLASRVKMRREEQSKQCPLGGGPLAASNPSRGKNLQAFRSRLRAIKESRKAESTLHQKKERLRSSICARLIAESPAQVYDDLMCTAMQRALAICGKEKDLAEFMQSSHREKGLFYAHRVFEEEALQRIRMDQQDNAAISQLRELDVCRGLAHRSATHSKHVQYEVRKAQWEIQRAENTGIVVGILNVIIELTFRVVEYKGKKKGGKKKGREPTPELMKQWLSQLESTVEVPLDEQLLEDDSDGDLELEEEEMEQQQQQPPMDGMEMSGGPGVTASGETTNRKQGSSGEKNSNEGPKGSGGKAGGSGSGGKAGGSGSGGKGGVSGGGGAKAAKAEKPSKGKGKGGRKVPPNTGV